MPLTVPVQGEILLLQYILNIVAPPGQGGTTGAGPILRLYQNNVTLNDQVSNANLSEATQAGYTCVTCTMWTVSVLSGTAATASHSEVTFSFTTSAAIYGCFFTDHSNQSSPTRSGLLWVEQFSGAPFNLPTGGGSISISPKIAAE